MTEGRGPEVRGLDLRLFQKRHTSEPAPAFSMLFGAASLEMRNTAEVVSRAPPPATRATLTALTGQFKPLAA